ncbi:MAG: DUF721 domain-containing protein [Prevotellaceae bacterium]|nr:DUF721 domain-containing protein [Prevotellaceae bacterium]
MFRRKEQHIATILRQMMRDQGLETPLLQKRLMDSWSNVVGESVAQYSKPICIRNQILYVEVANPALRSDLYMSRSRLVMLLNDQVQAQIITDIIYK